MQTKMFIELSLVLLMVCAIYIKFKFIYFIGTYVLNPIADVLGKIIVVMCKVYGVMFTALFIITCLEEFYKIYSQK